MTVNQQYCTALTAEKAQERKKKYSASIKKKKKENAEQVLRYAKNQERNHLFHQRWW